MLLVENKPDAISAIKRNTANVSITREPPIPINIAPTAVPSPNNHDAPVATADWIIYTNTGYGYSLQYPRDARIESLNPADDPRTSAIVSIWNKDRVLLAYAEVYTAQDIGPGSDAVYRWVTQHFVPASGGTIIQTSVHGHDAVREREPTLQPLGISYTFHIKKDTNTIVKLSSNRIQAGSSDEDIFAALASSIQFNTR